MTKCSKRAGGGGAVSAEFDFRKLLFSHGLTPLPFSLGIGAVEERLVHTMGQETVRSGHLDQIWKLSFQ
jgi:hypothetical protein